MTIKLGHLLGAVKDYDLSGNPDREITGLAYDSREVKPGYLFVAIRGHALDGHGFIGSALERGAAALVVEAPCGVEAKIATVRVKDSRKTLSKMASRFFGYPDRAVRMIGITGTNGKTTVSYLLESVLSAAGRRTGVIGTINYRIGGESEPAPVTTPESLDLMRQLRRMADRGATDVIMEVSSHALDQGRTGDCTFEAGIFTNLTRDHLDYHGSMTAYFNAKSRMFRDLDRKALAVINQDDPYGRSLCDLTKAQVITYGLGEGAQIRASILSADSRGLRVELTAPSGIQEIRSSLLGEVNVYNILACAATALALGVDFETVSRGIEALKVVPGRLEGVENDRGLTVVVDYAHTPDALLKAMKTLRPLTEGRLITVFGCGGDRDRGKRYDMGLAAGTESDLVIVTSDNPRSEDPASIMAEIEKGVLESGMTRRNGDAGLPFEGDGYLMESDRRKAIRKAFQMAADRDLILIAGKGHEDYQIVAGKKKHFDDREEAVLAAAEE